MPYAVFICCFHADDAVGFADTLARVCLQEYVCKSMFARGRLQEDVCKRTFARGRLSVYFCQSTFAFSFADEAN